MKRSYPRLSRYRLRAINARILEADKKLFIRRVRNLVIAVLALLSLTVSAGIAYAWYTANQSGPVAEDIAPISTAYRPNLTPSKPPEDANVGVAAHSFTSPIEPGGRVNVSIKTLPDAVCKISLKYDKEKESVINPSLVDKIADEYGTVNWTWTMAENSQTGKWPVDITCTRGTKSGVYSQDLIVKI
jgi:hypothetical protein